MNRMLRVARISVPLACAAALLVIAVQVLAAGPICSTTLNVNTGAVICSEASCTSDGQTGTCKAVGSWDPLDETGWHPAPMTVTQWLWDPVNQVWVFQAHLGAAEIANCACTGPDDEQGHYSWVGENLCCNLVKIKDGESGFLIGTMGLCSGPCPASHPNCKPQMNAGGFLAEATCQQ